MQHRMSRGGFFSTIIVLVALLSLVACAAPAGEVPTKTPALTEEALQNAEYQSEWAEGGLAKLTNGEYRASIVPDSATELVIKLGEIAIGDLNGDGIEDAAAILYTDPGGSGTFCDLAAVVDQEGTPKNVASALLSDRVKIQGLTIESGEVVVNMVTHGPDDPRCCPTLEVTKKYRLQRDKLVEVPGDK